MSPDTGAVLLTAAVPILLGALIGYVTNDLAVRMLFRPLKEYRLWGWRIPFTPGIIPRQRKSLAANIGRMVSQQLLTADTVRLHLSQPSAVEKLGGEIEGVIRLWAEKPLRDSLGQLNQDWLGPLVRQAVTGFLPRLLDLKPAVLFADPKAALAALNGALASYLEDSQARTKVQTLVRSILKDLTRNPAPLLSLTGPETPRLIRTLLEELWPELGQALLKWLRTPDTRAWLIRHGREFLQTVIQRMNGVQKFFLTAVQYDRNLDQSMPDIIADLTNRLEQLWSDPDQKAGLVTAAVQALTGFLDRPFSAWPLDDRERLGLWLEDLAGRLFDTLVRQLQDPDDSPLSAFLVPMMDQPLRELAGRLGWTEDRLADFLTDKVGAWLTSARASALTPAGLLGWQTENFRTAGHLLAKTALNSLEPRVEALLQGLNLQVMIENKINGLEPLEVERLLMAVLKKHLKWINIFGALLGALMGAVQVILPK